MAPRRLRRPTPAMVVALLALLVALGGSSYAAVRIGSKQLVDNSVRSKDVRNNSLRSRDVRNRSLLAKDFKAGQLPAGQAGPRGEQGPAGAPGLSGFEIVSAQTVTDGATPKELTLVCPPGKTAIAGGYRIQVQTAGIVVDASRNPGGAFTDRWYFHAHEDQPNDLWQLDAQAICAKLDT